MARSYHTLDSQTSDREETLTLFLRKNGQQLLPLVDLITQSRVAINELIDCVGRALLETVLEVSAQQVAGVRQPGKARTEVVGWYGRQAGRVYLGDRKLAVERPRLRRRGRGSHKEVSVPAYAALQNRQAMQKRMLDILMNGVSTRHYRQVIPAMAESVGISKSSVSRETIEASEAALQELLERRLDDKDFLIIYIDGLHCGEHCVLGAVGVDTEGPKAGAGYSGRSHGERGGLPGYAAESGRARSGSRTGAIVRHRRLEGVAQRDSGSVRSPSAGAAMSSTQVAKCGGALAPRTARANALADSGGLETGCQRRHDAAA